MANNKNHFQFNNIPDLSGKVAIITGGSAGIGESCAFQIARKNCTVILGCRNKSKGELVVKKIQEETGNNNVECILLDLNDLKSIKSFAEMFLSKYDQLHILINNAGLMPNGGLERSKDGFEIMFATNVIGTHYLTVQLLPILEKSMPSRIVNVASSFYIITKFVKTSVEILNDEDYYNRFLQYGRTKAIIMLLTFELDRRLRAKGVNNLYVNTNDPGPVKTQAYYKRVNKGSVMDKFISLVFAAADEGSLTQLYLATSPEVEEQNIHGEYYTPIAKRDKVKSDYTKSEKEAEKAWSAVEKLIKEKIPDYPGANI
ncbi:hypothetical protein INT45_009429 [Circinella minor]|uniref:Uncharacterized protein n=1 Tax=Circinella minor TaxID=1195481 RepID=A0A8H7S637_9FUNG|nr:hypothetical protein INT45_009429 [Circinella minor]